jgi:hypothetical protein
MWERLNEKVKQGGVNVTKVVVMPAEAAVNRQGFKGSEGMTKEGDELAAKFTNEVQQTIKAAGLQVLPDPFSKQQMLANEERRSEMLRLQKQFDEVHKQIDPQKGAKTIWGSIGDVRSANRRVRQGTAKVNEETISSDAFADCDALVFPRINGSVLTGGKRAMSGLVVGLSMKTNMNYDFTFVSAQTGEVLATYTAVHTSSLKKQMEKPLIGSAKNKIQKSFVKGKKKGKT